MPRVRMRQRALGVHVVFVASASEGEAADSEGAPSDKSSEERLHALFRTEPVKPSHKVFP